MKSWRTMAILTMGVTIAYVNGLEAIGMLRARSAIASTLKSTVRQLPNQQNSLNHLAQALAPEQVNLRAKQITVRIDGANIGSGSIINRAGDVYTVLSNWHVMKNTGEYIVQTIDGRTHQVNPSSIKQLPGLDLAVFQFSSNQNYQLAEIGNSGQLNEGQNVYFAGYPGELRQEDNRYYRFFPANLVGILPNSTENGYSLIYNGEAFPGMSGGPVFDKNGILVGIHGEANINAITGGTSNYAIPINTYKQAIAKLESQPKVENSAPPEVTVETKPETTTATETPTTEDSKEAETSEAPEISSVPTLSDSEPANNADDSQQQANQPEEESTVNETVDQSQQEANQPEEESDVNETADQSQQQADQPEEESDVNQTADQSQQQADQPEKSDVFDSTTSVASTSPPNSSTVNSNPQKLTLISKATGIDYTHLQDLLKEKKWKEADIHTYRLIDQIVKTAKKQNRHMFIELKTVAEFSCNDVRTIDILWQKYSGNKFGFSPQQKIWQNVNQNGDFSTQTWRRFATEVGWKEGDVASGSGYLLFDQLDFNPEQAPIGHLPWWFSLPDEQQNVIKHLFARCDLNPSVQKVKPNSPASREGDSQDSMSPNPENNDNSTDAPKNDRTPSAPAAK